MTRRKVKLSYITNEATRKATFKKRKKGLVKKVSELSTLCGVDACAVIYSPFETQPEVFPPSREGVHRVLSRFSRMPEMDQSRKMINQEGFLRQRIAKASDQLNKLRKENREKDVTRVMFQCMTSARPKILQGLTLVDLKDLEWVVDQKLKEVRKRIGEVVVPAQREVVGAAEREVVVEEEDEDEEEEDNDEDEDEEDVEELEGEAKVMRAPPPPPPGSRDLGKKVVDGGGSSSSGGGGGGSSSGGGGGAVLAGLEGGGGSDGEKLQSFMDLMMNHQGHHENKIMNLGFENAWESSTYLGDRVFR